MSSADIVEFVCTICAIPFRELEGGRCSQCGNIVCRTHLHTDKKALVCSRCLRLTESGDESDDQ